MKMCNVCKDEKTNNFFHRDKSRADGLSYRCKECDKKISSSYRKKNPGKSKDIIKKWFKDNPHKNREAVKRYQDKNRDMVREKHRKYNAEHPEKNREITKRYRNTPKGKLRHSISNGILRSLNGNKDGKCWALLLDYSIDQLKHHIEKQFKDGMSWENYGQWHIDHKIPISVFNFETPDDIDFKKCWELKNLQPMWALENIRKRDKLDKPFQPSLRIAI